MKPQEKKFFVESLAPLKKKIQELHLRKVKDESTTHYYGRHEGNDVAKFVVYPDRVVLRSLKEVNGKFEFGEDRALESKDEGFKWLKEKGFSNVDVVEMEYEEYAHKGGTVGLYVINSELYSVILFYPPGRHSEIETEFGLNQAEAIAMPFNKYLEKIGKARFVEI